MLVTLYRTSTGRLSFRRPKDGPAPEQLQVQAPAGSELLSVLSFAEPLLFVPVGPCHRLAHDAGDVGRLAHVGGLGFKIFATALRPDPLRN